MFSFSAFGCLGQHTFNTVPHWTTVTTHQKVIQLLKRVVFFFALRLITMKCKGLITRSLRGFIQRQLLTKWQRSFRWQNRFSNLTGLFSASVELLLTSGSSSSVLLAVTPFMSMASFFRQLVQIPNQEMS